MAISDAVCRQGDEALGVSALNNPKLKQHSMINILATAMSKRVSKFYLYGSLQNDTLIFYFAHNAIAMEFTKELDEFREKIIPLYKEHKMRDIIFFKKIEARVENRRPNRPKEPEKYRDVAKGDFDNLAKDDAIKKAFEILRGHIKDSQ